MKKTFFFLLYTAAHCFRLPDGAGVPSSAMLVSLGRYRLRDWDGPGSQNVEVETYVSHPEYGVNDLIPDIGILTLRETITFSHNIQPVCLWNGPSDLPAIVGRVGYVVGWGKDEAGNAYTAEPRLAIVPIVSQVINYCIYFV